jgi:2-(1,2-epoxy-1,2-dihydrophenyl)acetyl-CoA isomerase
MTAAPYSAIDLQTQDGIALLALNRPDKLNAVDLVLRNELLQAIDALRRDASLRALVLTGRGKAFCSGGDIQTMAAGHIEAEAGRARLAAMGTLVEMLVGFERPVIAAVNGIAYGAGFGLAMAADFVLASSEARFCASFGRIGLVPDTGLHWTLPRRVGTARAKALIFATSEVGAEEALALGIADRLSEPANLLGDAMAFARGFVEASPAALSLSKEMIEIAMGADLKTIVRMEAAAQGIAFSTDYHRDAAARFVAKRPRRFPPAGWPKK